MQRLEMYVRDLSTSEIKEKLGVIFGANYFEANEKNCEVFIEDVGSKYLDDPMGVFFEIFKNGEDIITIQTESSALDAIGLYNVIYSKIFLPWFEEKYTKPAKDSEDRK